MKRVIIWLALALVFGVVSAFWDTGNELTTNPKDVIIDT